MRFEVILLLRLCFLGIMALPRVGAGGDDSMKTVVELNQEAMDDYQNMDIDGAIADLTKAEEICIAEAAIGPELALTYLNRGPVGRAARPPGISSPERCVWILLSR